MGGWSTVALNTPWLYLSGFLCASALMIICLNHLQTQNLEGTVLGTVIMPYFSGAPNLIFTLVMGYRDGPGKEVVINCLVNNMTNLSLLIALPCIFWGLDIIPKTKKSKKLLRAAHVNRYSLILTLVAAFVFTGALWALGRDGRLIFTDGLLLVGLFFFYQLFVFVEDKKRRIEKNLPMGGGVVFDLIGLTVSVAVMLYCVDWLVDWLQHARFGFISYEHIGWLSGWLMVLPNAIPAFYYALRQRADIVYSSQVGDGHICIPLCIGLFALFNAIEMPSFAETGIYFILAMATVHLFAVVFLGRLPRLLGVFFLGAYGVFVFKGLISN